MAWIIFGLIAGARAKLIMAGDDSGGIIVIVGAVIGGFIGGILGFGGVTGSNIASVVIPILGAVSLLLLYRMVARRWSPMGIFRRRFPWSCPPPTRTSCRDRRTLARRAVVVAERDTTWPGQSGDLVDHRTRPAFFARHGARNRAQVARRTADVFRGMEHIASARQRGEMNGHNPMGSRDRPGL